MQFLHVPHLIWMCLCETTLQLCVRSMAALETIGPLMCGMKVRADMAGLACEALNRMFQREQTDLVAQVTHSISVFFNHALKIKNWNINWICVYCMQALRVELVPYLLKLLEGVGLETLDNPSATKAQIVKALKSMTRSLHYGEQVKNTHTYTHRSNKYINNWSNIVFSEEPKASWRGINMKLLTLTNPLTMYRHCTQHYAVI